jgi:hypothetical protein
MEGTMRAAVIHLLESAESTMRRIVEAQRVLEAERRVNAELGKLETALKAVHMAFVLAQRDQRTGAA